MYEIRLPAEPLREHIENYWFVSAPPEAPVDLRVDVFVDARADLIFNFGAPYVRAEIGGRSRRMSRSNLDAQRLVPIRIAQRGAVRTSGVRFRLGGVGPFTRKSLADFTGRTPGPSVVFGSGATILERELAATADLDAQASLLDRFFLGARIDDEALGPFHVAARAAVAEDGAVSVERMAEMARTTVRQLQRSFVRFLGIPPRTLTRVLRFQKAMRMLMRDPEGTLADVASDAGYFDQAHFVREFRRMTGGVPRGYRGYFPENGPSDFAPNVVVFVQDRPRRRL
ncbi:MAG: helix-turn-helix domain-containing protein [Polyangiaceae bacterium]